MHRSQDALKLALALSVALLGTGCGALINGTQQTITVKAADPKAEMFVSGAKVGTGSVQLTGSPSFRPTVYIRDSTGAVTRFTPDTEVSGAAIALDVLWCLTILGVAAPISDGLMGTFVGLEEPDGPIAVPPAPARQRRIEYAP
jgi:hypothetical protein